MDQRHTIAAKDDGGSVMAPPEPCATPGLADMPIEIHARIIAHIDRPSHLLALRCASPLFGEANPVAAAIVWGAQRMHRLLRAGAPLDVVTSALVVRNRPLCATAVVHAVKGRRLAVVRAIFETVAVCPPVCFLSLSLSLCMCVPLSPFVFSFSFGCITFHSI